MFEGKRIGAILLMAGVGTRFGASLPKQFLRLGGKQVYKYALQTFLESGYFDEILLVCHPDWVEAVSKDVSVRVLAGGKTRQESSYLGLLGFETPPDIVVIHDAVRPFVTSEILKTNIEKAQLYGAVDTCIPSADTLVFSLDRKKIASIPNRAELFRGQTPQTFRYDWILEAHEKASAVNASDDCQLIIDQGREVQIALGSERNIKITTEFDLAVAESLLKKQGELVGTESDGIERQSCCRHGGK
jgi:2-C-methyl-D-erythritol 4-phosphate cytidylyltransferase